MFEKLENIMQSKLLTLIGLVFIGSILTACGDSKEEANETTKEAIEVIEPVDVEATEQLNAKLLESMQEISNQQLDDVEDAGKEALEQLSEADRQALIDLTIDESSKAVSEDAEKVVELLEDINGVNE